MMPGTIYLLHFSESLAHARHYLGYVDGDLERRLRLHRSGNGARLMSVLKDRGIGFELARTWSGTRSDERRLKRRKDSPRLCPICRSGGGR